MAYTQQEIDAALQAELAARPGSSLSQILNSASNYGINADQVNAAYQNMLANQILASSDPTKWTGEGFGSAQANADDMAKVLGRAGITDISQLGVKTVNVPGTSYWSGSDNGDYVTSPDTTQQVYYNKDTGQAITPGYDRAGGNIFSGTFAGSGSTGYGVQYDAQGNPHFYTQYGGSTSDIGTIAPILSIAAMALAPELMPMLGQATGLSGAALSGAYGAASGAGIAGLTGGDVLKGAALGGIGGYAAGSLGGAGSEYNFNGPNATNPTMAELTGTGGLTGLDQYAGIPTDLGAFGGNVGNVGESTNGYYDEITGKFIQDPNGPLQGPLDNTSGTNLSSMNGYNYDPASGTWTMPDGTQVATIPGNPYKSTSGADILKSAGAGLAGAGGAATGGGLLNTLTNTPLGTATLLGAGTNLLSNLATNNAISNAASNQAAAAQQAGSTLKDIYNQQLGFVQPYQQLGTQGVNAISANMPYLQHQFNAADLQAGLAPNYDFMLQQGQMANQRAANMGGGAIGGNALQGLNKFTQDYAGNAYQNAFNNYQTQRQNIYNTLSNIAGLGQTANQQAIGAGTGYGQQQTALTTGLAAAQAGANVAQAQNTSNTLNNIANNVTLASLLGQRQSVAGQ